MIMRPLLFILAVLAAACPALAHDPSGYWAREAQAGRAPPAEWWKSLHAPNGGIPCCDIADGQRVEDVDWDTQRGEDGKPRYRVRLIGKWIDVPDDAVIDEPNRYGPAVVWPVFADDGEGHHVAVAFIRCFLPGAGA